jgi:hypothetical protein
METEKCKVFSRSGKTVFGNRPGGSDSCRLEPMEDCRPWREKHVCKSSSLEVVSGVVGVMDTRCMQRCVTLVLNIISFYKNMVHDCVLSKKKSITP